MTLSFALALALGGVLLVRAVKHTVLEAAETADRGALADVSKQLASGVPIEKLVAPDEAPRRIYLRSREQVLPFPPMDRQAFFIMLPPGGEPRAAAGARDLLFERRVPAADDPRWLVVRGVAHVPGGGPIELFAARPLEELRRSAETLAQVLWIGIPLLIALIAVTAWLVVGRALSPVDAMTRQVQRIGASNLHERLPEPRARDAIGELARMLNRMLDRLDEAARVQRQFTSNASHELRSPVASIRTQLEVALARPGSVDWDAVARGILAEDRRLEALVADLLLLARLDEQAAPPRADVDLEDVVLDEARRPRRVPVDTASIEPARVGGHAAQLACVARNLLDNAGRHARSQVSVGLRCDERGRVARLWVDDDGPGIPAADRERVFERFTRLEEGRSRDAGGVGLGLALVRRVVERHGGEVAIGQAPLGGARVEVTLPLGAGAGDADGASAGAGAEADAASAGAGARAKGLAPPRRDGRSGPHCS
ncbi:MAG TPA: HAMP domain-containing sensor histidine kinase [Kofleriaceae bacterium]|nr:HAMP domain-containing sensor histidine kinase [Kofleriaceae bacterium]